MFDTEQQVTYTVCMQCPVCFHDSFLTFPTSKVETVDTDKYVLGVAKTRVSVEVVFRCMRCSTEIAGTWEGPIVVSVSQQPRSPFSREILKKVHDEYLDGWWYRFKGRRIQALRGYGDAAVDGWKAAEKWSVEHNNRAPPNNLSKETVGTYMETEEAWEYMKQLKSNESWLKSSPL
jgi:hypothetical protein